MVKITRVDPAILSVDFRTSRRVELEIDLELLQDSIAACGEADAYRRFGEAIVSALKEYRAGRYTDDKAHAGVVG